MRITKQGHSCVRLEKDGAVLVIDPGIFSAPDAAVGADAIAITHEHPDHFDLDRLRAAAKANPDLEIWTHQGIAEQLAELSGMGARVQRINHGDVVETAGFDLHAYGERHAVIHPDIPVVVNVGFRVDSALFHPGDALTVPEDPVSTLLLPLQAPWLKSWEMIDYARKVSAERVIPIHNGLLKDEGLAFYHSQVALAVGEERRTVLGVGESLDLS